MTLVLTEGPQVEPISLPELKVHLRLDGHEEDTLLASLIVAARLHVEQTYGLALIKQSWSCYLDRWPETPELRLPLAPVRGVNALRIYDVHGTAVNIDPAEYLMDAASRPVRLVRRPAAVLPAPGRPVGGVEIAFQAGFGEEACDVPAPIRQALLMLAVDWYDDRAPAALESQLIAPQAVWRLLGPYREARL
jgi:uncharacterized phiE125 gp8 family phage protein